MNKNQINLLVENLRKLCVILTGIADVLDGLMAEDTAGAETAIKAAASKPALSLPPTEARTIAVETMPPDPDTVEAFIVNPVVDKPKSKKKAKVITKEEVRAALAEKARNGHSAEIKAIINAHGAQKLTEIDPSEYASVLKDAEAIDA